MSAPIDLRHDLHGHAFDYMLDQDRRFFETHPHVLSYCREPFEHELCDPRAAVKGECRSVIQVAPDEEVMIRVTRLAPGVRGREFILITHDGLER